MDTPNKFVFINCSFDSVDRPLFEAIVFAIEACGYIPRCALERIDSGDDRLAKIHEMIGQCDFGIHDISCTGLSDGLPRFNMPFELGMAIARKMSNAGTPIPRLLILDNEPHRYDRFLSDLGGRDVSAHGGDPKTAIATIREWLASFQPLQLPAAGYLAKWFDEFLDAMPKMRTQFRLGANELQFNELAAVVKCCLDLTKKTTWAVPSRCVVS